MMVDPFRGSGEVLRPDQEMVQGRKNRDFFANRKAQAWWELRMRFMRTFRAVTQGVKTDPDELIAISSEIAHKAKLTKELSQPTFSINGAGKIVIDKAPDEARSPNLADAVMICYASNRSVLRVSQAAVAAMQGRR